ncbi:hypothetical protein ACFU0X_14725 [Streptomyces cellulosae]|uniref:Nucleopolyhedrovirus P10 family protein n=1 Tax=Streptomyces cellulosae TaxID=1968 RepID=A0ABW6JHV4_STRCE
MTADRWTRMVRQQVRLGRFLPLGGPYDGAWIAERAARGALRAAAEREVPEVRLDGVRLGLADLDTAVEPAVPAPPSALPPGPLRLTAEFATTAAWPLPETASRLRTALAVAATERVGLDVVEVDLRVTELLDEEPGAGRGGAAEPPEGADGAGGARTPGGSDGSGTADTPEAADSAGGARTPGGADGSGTADTPKDADETGAADTPKDADRTRGARTPGGADGAGAADTPKDADETGAADESGSEGRPGSAGTPRVVGAAGAADAPEGAGAPDAGRVAGASGGAGARDTAQAFGSGAAVDRGAGPEGERVADVVLGVPGVSRLTGVWGRGVRLGERASAAGDALPRRHARVDLAVAAGFRPLEVARAVRAAVAEASADRPTVAVLVTDLD